MATIGTLLVAVGLDPKKLGKGLKKTEKMVDKAGKNMDGLTVATEKVGDSMDEVGQKGRKNLDDIDAKTANAKGSMLGFLKTLGGGATALAVGALGLISAAVISIGAAVFDMGTEYQSVMSRMQAQTGKTGAELEALGDTTVDIFNQGFGTGLEDVGGAVGQVSQVLGETGDALADSTKKAIIMRDVFGIDIPESLRAVRSASKAFGVENSQVFDMMAATIQRVGDPAGDLADTINEYSADFAQAGFTAEEMFGILNAGVAAGARNFDSIADLVREFTIRIVDGSDSTSEAMMRLFEITGQGGETFFKLKNSIDQTTLYIKAHEQALKESEGAYKAQEKVVGDLQRQLSEARRELDELARPKLQGMEKFDDKLFDLEQQSKRAQLALLDLEPDSKAYEKTQELLDDINAQMDKVSLKRDLIFDEQLRNIEKAATAGTEKLVTYEEAMANIAAKKEEIAGIETNLAIETDTLGGLGATMQQEAANVELFKARLEDMQAQFDDMASPAKTFFDQLGSGEMTARDAMSQVIGMLGQVGNKMEQEQIGVALFGSKFEELGFDIVQHLDPAVAKLTDFEGAADAAGEAMQGTVGNSIEQVKRKFISFFATSEEFQRFMDGLIVVVDQVAGKLMDSLGPAAAIITDAFKRINIALGGTGEGVDIVSVALDAIQFVLEGVVTAVQLTALAFNGLASAIEWVVSLGGSLKEFWEKSTSKMKDLGEALPDWLKPGSPPPLAFALQDIKKGLQALPSFDDAFSVGGTGSPAALAGVGGGGQTSNITINAGGITATSTTNGDPVETAMSIFAQMVTQALRREES